MDLLNVISENQFHKRMGELIMQSSFENLFMLLVADHPDLSQAQASSVCATI